MDEVDVEGCDDVRDCEWRRETRYAERELKWNKLKVSLNFHIDSRMNTMWCTSLYIAYTLCLCVYPSAFMKAREKMKAISSLTLPHTFCIQPSVQLFVWIYVLLLSAFYSMECGETFSIWAQPIDSHIQTSNRWGIFSYSLAHDANISRAKMNSYHKYFP